MIEFIAWILIVLCVINVFGVPLLFGRSVLKEYNYSYWLQTIVMATPIIIVSGRVLGWF
jgi:hypothetical protein